MNTWTIHSLKINRKQADVLPSENITTKLNYCKSIAIVIQRRTREHIATFTELAFFFSSLVIDHFNINTKLF